MVQVYMRVGRGGAPFALYHALSLLQVQSTATALALPAVLAHDTPLGTLLAPAGRLVSKSCRWTMGRAGLFICQKMIWGKEERHDGNGLKRVSALRRQFDLDLELILCLISVPLQRGCVVTA